MLTIRTVKIVANRRFFSFHCRSNARHSSILSISTRPGPFCRTISTCNRTSLPITPFAFGIIFIIIFLIYYIRTLQNITYIDDPPSNLRFDTVFQTSETINQLDNLLTQVGKVGQDPPLHSIVLVVSLSVP